MIGIGTSLLFGRRAGNAGSPIPPFNDAMVDAWFMSGFSNNDKPSSIRGVKGNEVVLKNFAFTSESGFGEGNYEDALVFDGVDDYGICTGLPIFDDYTLICRREFTREAVSSKRDVINNTGAFVSEGLFENKGACYSYGTNNAVTVDGKDSVTYMTPTSYNGQPITRGNWKDNDFLLLGASFLQNDKALGFMQGAIYYYALYNKSLTPEEIETEKERLNEEWLKRSKVTIPEPDVYYDLSLKDNSSPTRNIIDDLSGNGHDAEIFNAAYTESSGYRSDGAFVFDNIDDYAIMQNVTKGFKTLFVEVVPLNLDATMYDQRINSSYTNFSIINKSGYVAYEYNNEGLTYINGKQSTANDLADNLLNKRQIITVTNGKQSDCKTIYIAANYNISSFSNMALYKLIGFYDELTSLQIEKVINDYKLKHD